MAEARCPEIVQKLDLGVIGPAVSGVLHGSAIMDCVLDILPPRLFFTVEGQRTR